MTALSVQIDSTIAIDGKDDTEQPPGAAIEDIDGAEDELFRSWGLVFEFDEQTSTWVNHIKGDARILRSPSKAKTRLVIRNEKTFQIYTNHWISRKTKLQQGVGSDRTWVWKADNINSTTQHPQSTTYAIRFSSPEIAATFKEVFDKGRKALLEGHSLPDGIPAQIELLKLERARIDSQIALLELQTSDDR